MYSYSTLILFPKVDDYSSIHEWPFVTALKAHANCILHPYHTNNDLGRMIHQYTQGETIRTIIIFGSDEQWLFLNATLSHHPNCDIQSPVGPYPIYARLKPYTHLLGLSANTNNLALTTTSLSNYFHALDPHTLENLSRQVGHTLQQKGYTVSCAESCTGGLIAKSLTDIAGASTYFCGGVCTYTANTKIKVLQVPETTITENGIVSQETAAAMAIGAKQLFDSDIALSTTGVAGPGADSDGNPEGLVYCCIIIHNNCYINCYNASDETLFTDRSYIRTACTIFILEKLLTYLQH